MNKSMMILCCLSVFMIGTLSKAGDIKSSSPHLPDNDTVLLFHFDEGKGNPRDSSGKANHAKENTAIFITDGKFGSALRFDGNSSVTIPHNDILNMNTDEFTIDLWIRTTSKEQSSLLSKGLALGGQAGSYQFFLNRLKKSVYFGITVARKKSTSVFKRFPKLFDGQWHRITVTYGEGVLGLYVDGKQVRDRTFNSAGMVPTKVDMYLGRKRKTYRFKGDIDELMISKKNIFPSPAFDLSSFAKLPSAKGPAKLIKNLESGLKQHIITYGSSLTASGAWVSQLAKILKQKYPNQVIVKNSGGNGKASNWGRIHLEARVLKHNPDVVIMEFGINDAYLKRMSVKGCRKNVENILDRILARNPKCEIILMTMNPPIGEHLEARKNIEAYYQVYRDIARERNLMLIDHHVVWKSILEKDKPVFDYYVYDGIHPGIIGCAKVITPNIIKALYDKP